MYIYVCVRVLVCVCVCVCVCVHMIIYYRIWSKLETRILQ